MNNGQGITCDQFSEMLIRFKVPEKQAKPRVRRNGTFFFDTIRPRFHYGLLGSRGWCPYAAPAEFFGIRLGRTVVSERLYTFLPNKSNGNVGDLKCDNIVFENCTLTYRDGFVQITNAKGGLEAPLYLVL